VWRKPASRSEVLRGAIAALALVSVLAGCVTGQAYREGEKAMKAQNFDQAVVSFSKALAAKPDNTRYKVAVARARTRAAQTHFSKGSEYMKAQLLEEAIAEFQQAVYLDQSHQFAANELQKALSEWQKIQARGEWNLEAAKKKASPGREAPRLSPSSNIPIVLRFKDEGVKKIYDALSKASGINFIYEERLPLDKKISIDIADVTFEQALEQLMTMNKHFFKIIDENSILIAEDTQQKHKELDDLVIQTFFLSNADVKDVQVLLRTLLDARQIAQNDRLNAITIRDTPERVMVAQKIIEANDKAKSELIIDVELLEVNRNILRNLGIDLFGAGTGGGTGKSLNLTFGGGSSVSLNNLDLLKQAGSWLVGPIPGVVVNFLKTDADAQVIAKPQLRVSEGAKATVRIGDRIPIPNTTFNAAPTVGGNIGVPITSFTYQNVGINIDLEPRVHHNREITLKGKVEISALAGSVSAGGGLTQPIIGTREIETTIRLRDNETNILAGLLRETERKSMSGVAGLSDIPVLKRLFGSTETTIEQTDIVLMMTPHIIRIPDISDEDLQPLWIGTEQNVELRGASRKSAYASPFEAGQAQEAYPGIPDIQEEVPETPPAAAKENVAEPAAPSPQEGPAVVPVPATGITEPVPVGAEAPTEPSPVESPGPTNGTTGGQQPTTGQAPPPAPPPAQTPPQTQPPQTPPGGPATVTLNPSYMTASLGRDFKVSVEISGAVGVGSVPFHLAFDPQFLEFVGAGSSSPFLGQDGTPVFVLATLGAGGREVIAGLSRQGSRPGVSGKGVLLELTFRPKKPVSATTLSLSDLSVLDPQAQPLAHETVSMTVVIQ
jgi:general secretion pathway protein D